MEIRDFSIKLYLTDYQPQSCLTLLDLSNDTEPFSSLFKSKAACGIREKKAFTE